MNKKTVISATDDTIHKLKVLAKEKKNFGSKLVVTAKKLSPKAKEIAVTTKRKDLYKNKKTVISATDDTILELKVKAKNLAVTAKEKEDIRLKLEVVAKELAKTAKDREDIRKELEVTAEKLRLKAEALVVTAKEKEDVRQKLAVTATELKGSRETLEQKVIERTKDLANAKARNDAFLESIGEGLVVVDKEGNVIYINKSFENLLGWKASEIIGRNMSEVVPTEDQIGTTVLFKERILSRVLSGERFVADLTNPFYFIRKDNVRFPVSIVVTPVVLNGKIVGAIETFRDVTKEKEIDKSKSEFVSLASHQLRTPLGIMKWYLETLAQDDYYKKAPVEIKKYFDEIYKNNERELSLVRDLLSASRIEQGKVKNTLELVDVIKLISEIVEQMKILAKEKNITLTPTINDPNIPSITIDILRLREVLENLIENAIEYTEAKGNVQVIVSREDDKLTMSVKDTGIGISKNDQKKLFTRFFRLEQATGHNPEGAGLGLYVVKSYVESWGGKITVESTEGVGSTFTISLPITQKKDILNKE